MNGEKEMGWRGKKEGVRSMKGGGEDAGGGEKGRMLGRGDETLDVRRTR